MYFLLLILLNGICSHNLFVNIISSKSFIVSVCVLFTQSIIFVCSIEFESFITFIGIQFVAICNVLATCSILIQDLFNEKLSITISNFLYVVDREFHKSTISYLVLISPITQ